MRGIGKGGSRVATEAALQYLTRCVVGQALLLEKQLQRTLRGNIGKFYSFEFRAGI